MISREALRCKSIIISSPKQYQLSEHPNTSSENIWKYQKCWIKSSWNVDCQLSLQHLGGRSGGFCPCGLSFILILTTILIFSFWSGTSHIFLTCLFFYRLGCYYLQLLTLWFRQFVAKDYPIFQKCLKDYRIFLHFLFWFARSTDTKS